MTMPYNSVMFVGLTNGLIDRNMYLPKNPIQYPHENDDGYHNPA